jgi:two-component system KDP operon response regulator KdpE
MHATILVVDDDKELARLLSATLKKEGYQILCAHDGVEGLLMLKEERPDLVLLDLMLPRMDGWETCRRIRDYSNVPIIMLTALGSERDMVKGLELGADDYIVKPYRLSELRARIHAGLRRYKYSLSGDSTIEIDERLAIDRANARLLVDGQHVELSPIEYKLLRCFVDNAGRILSHQVLLTQVWGWEYLDQTHYLKVYVYQLRKKMEKDPHEPRYILTERGLGYRFVPPIC